MRRYFGKPIMNYYNQPPRQQTLDNVKKCKCGKLPKWEKLYEKVRFICHDCDFVTAWTTRNIYARKDWNELMRVYDLDEWLEGQKGE